MFQYVSARASRGASGGIIRVLYILHGALPVLSQSQWPGHLTVVHGRAAVVGVDDAAYVERGAVAAGAATLWRGRGRGQGERGVAGPGREVRADWLGDRDERVQRRDGGQLIGGQLHRTTASLRILVATG